MTDEAEAPKKPRGRPFQPGNPGGGRKPGSRNKALIALEAIGTAAAEEIIQKAVDMAKAGDVQAIRIFVDRMWPIRKGAPVSFVLPDLSSPNGMTEAMNAVLAGVADGSLTPEEGTAVANLVETRRKAVETEDFAARLAALEERLK